MKRIITLAIVILITISGFPQNESIQSENVLGIAYYDFYCSRTIQNRLYRFEDGTIGAVWNMGQNYPLFPDLGIGYNFFDGASWGPQTTTVTSQWSRHPSYAPCLENGELVAYETLESIGFS
jgi:hypothetical protein